jgi:hypothetical protein
MLANQEDFDRDVKRVLQEVQGEEIPLDFLVDIEQRLDQLEKKKKRPLLVWIFTGIILASGLTFGLLLGNGKSNHSIIILPQKGTIPAKKTKGFTQVASLNKIQSSPMNTVHPAIARHSIENRISFSDSQVNGTFIRSIYEDQPDLMQTASPIETITSVKLPAISNTSKDLPVLLSDQISAVSTFSDTVKVVSPIKNDPMISEVSPTINSPEIVMNSDLPKWTHSVGFYTGMSGVVSSFQTDDAAWLAFVGSPDILKYREIRSTQERSTSSIDISLRYRMAKEHLVLQTGVDFFEWGEQIQYDYSFVFDGVNRYSYLSLPIYLGYRQAFSSFEWGANIGCSVGHVLQQNGRYIQPDLLTLSLEKARTWSATGMAQLEFTYIFDRYRFSLAPTYRMSLGNLVNSTFTKNRYFSFGLQMGMAYQF